MKLSCVCAGIVALTLSAGLGAAQAATTSVKCPNGTVTASTGSNGGQCSTSGPNGKTVGCSDGGNTSGGYCDKTTGMATCGTSVGSGSCTISKKKPHTAAAAPHATKAAPK